MFPAGIRRVIEIPIVDQTLFQTSCAIIAFGFYLFVSLWLFGELIAMYSYSESL